MSVWSLEVPEGKELEQKGLQLGFSDVQVVRYELMEDGCWAHKHINPIFLEPAELSYIQNDRKNNAFRYGMEVMGEYFRSQENGDDSYREKALMATREYAKIGIEFMKHSARNKWHYYIGV